MSAYALACTALFLAAVAQTSALWLTVEACFHRGQPRPRRLGWLALAVSGVLLSLHHGHALELALGTGLFDLRQALLALGIALTAVVAALAFRRG